MVRDLPKQGHSNIVSLFNAHKEDKTDFFKYYVPGVGTRFPEIGEMGESDDGKRFASGGEARVHWAMLQVYNAVHFALTTSELLNDVEAQVIVTSKSSVGLATWWRLGDSKMRSVFEQLQQRLLTAIEGKRPRITKIQLSVFGFSRGAAEARTFCQWIQKATNMRVGDAALNMRFLGIFDTVASVGLADSSPVGQGFMDWADGTMDINGVGQTVHYVAAHEIRQSFPLSTARIRSGYPSSTKEFVYPGAHSDIGGGYPPRSQGKAVDGRNALLSQIPLNDMYFEALNAGASLRTKKEMLPEHVTDFTVHGELDSFFSEYAKWTAYEEKENVAGSKGPPCENRMQYHMHLYWQWRAHVGADAKFRAMSSYTNADKQDQTDLWESEQDWRVDVKRAQEAVKPRRMFHPKAGYIELSPNATEVQREIVKAIAAANTVPQKVSDFFDRYVHDSHGGFWMLGPITDEERASFIAAIKQKKKKYDELMQDANRPGINPGYAANRRRLAASYELNSFERRVVEAQKNAPGSVPVMSDADAADLREIAGPIASSTLTVVLDTATRREPHGHGRYRRVFDRS
jgi:uncharacterized protein (DUF2235 family)